MVHGAFAQPVSFARAVRNIVDINFEDYPATGGCVVHFSPHSFCGPSPAEEGENNTHAHVIHNNINPRRTLHARN